MSEAKWWGQIKQVEGVNTVKNEVSLKSWKMLYRKKSKEMKTLPQVKLQKWSTILCTKSSLITDGVNNIISYKITKIENSLEMK